MIDKIQNDDFLFNQGATKGLSKIVFHDFEKAYSSLDLPNITIFKEQISSLKEMLLNAPPEKNQTKGHPSFISLHFLEQEPNFWGIISKRV